MTRRVSLESLDVESKRELVKQIIRAMHRNGETDLIEEDSVDKWREGWLDYELANYGSLLGIEIMD